MANVERKVSGRFAGIPIVTEARSANGCADDAMGTIGGGVAALLVEIAERLESMANDGTPAAIDLRSLPMNETERARLRTVLGEGEVTISLCIDGDSTIRETAISGVWWTEYRQEDGTVVAEFIEVAQVPGILPVDDRGELRKGAQRLRAEIAVMSGQSAAQRKEEEIGNGLTR